MTDTMTLTSPTAAAPTATTPTATSPAWSHLPHSGREDLFVEQRFAVVPEWMLDSTVSDTAFRLYAILARYGNTSGVRMPGRALLARRLHRSLDTVDRALKELTATGILSIERRSHDGRNRTNRYHLRTHDPDTPAGDTSPGSSRSAAATPGVNPQAQDPGDCLGGRTGAATPRRSSTARVAAALRPNPDVPTEHHLHPPHPQPHPRPHRRLPPRRRAGRRRRISTLAPTEPAARRTARTAAPPPAT